MAVGLVTGLIAEARIASRLGDAEAGNGTPEGAERAAEAVAARGATALISFGLAGGLDPARTAGDIVIPAEVTERGIVYRTDNVLAASLGPVAGSLLAGDRPVTKIQEKAALWAETGAAAIDLESGAVARVAQRRGLPFAVLRVICDPAGRTLPPAALAALDHGGAIAIANVAGSVIAHPGQIPALIQLARDAALARRALVGCVRRILDAGGLVVP